jgi:cystathionine beta-lyase/cystathionine gamma-synthase
VIWLNASNYEEVVTHLTDNTKMIFCETPSNPLVRVVDITYLKELTKDKDIMLVVDNTFATPYHQQPLALGADLVVHSATKGLGGHNDLMAGVIACADHDQYEHLWFTRQAIGTTLDAFSGSLLERGLKTFPIRAQKMAENALNLAQFLNSHSKIEKVYYPGLEEDEGHTVAKKQMKNGYGGILAFEITGTEKEARILVENLQLIKHAVSLGCTETLVCLPVLTTMLYLPPERRVSFGVKTHTIRLSAGIEEPNDLLADLKQALDKI